MSMDYDWNNSNGLENGSIPPNKACPFLKDCARINENCPTSQARKSLPYGCVYARLHSLNRITPSGTIQQIVLKRTTEKPVPAKTNV